MWAVKNSQKRRSARPVEEKSAARRAGTGRGGARGSVGRNQVGEHDGGVYEDTGGA